MRLPVLALGLALTALPAVAHDVTQHGITIIHPASRPVLAGRPAAAYMAIANDGQEADRLLGARSPAFEAVELHESYEVDGVARMRRVEVLEIPAGDTALLQPGSLHLMMFRPAEAHPEGGEFPLVLMFEHAGEIEVPVMVERIDAGGADNAHDHGATATP